MTNPYSPEVDMDTVEFVLKDELERLFGYPLPRPNECTNWEAGQIATCSAYSRSVLERLKQYAVGL